MKTKTKIVLSSVLAIILCASLIAGATFALFTNRSEVNIAVTSGKVEVKAELKDLKLYSAEADPEGSLTDEHGEKYKQVERTNGSFINGGTAEISDGVLTIEKITPGDKVEFKVEITNNSNVTIKYQTGVKVLSGEGLFKGLDVTIDGVEYNGSTQMSDWTELAPGGTIATKSVVVELPITEGNVYQNLSTSMQFTVEAVQGNAATAELDENTIYVYTVSDLFNVAGLMSSGAMKGKTIKLMNDIDLAGNAWTPINGWNGNLNGITFDGNGYSIKNMTTYDDTDAGFIRSNASSLAVKNLTFDGASVSTKANQNQSYAGVLIGKNYSNLTVEKVNVKNSAVNNNWQCGGIIGFSESCTITFKSCKVEDSHFGGLNATAGTLFGLGYVDVNVEGCTAKNVTLYTDSLTWNSTAKADGSFWVGHLYTHTLTKTGTNTETNVTVNGVAP